MRLQSTYRLSYSVPAADGTASDVHQAVSTQSLIRLSEDKISQFYRDGYVQLPEVASAADVTQISELLNNLFARFEKLPKDLVHDLDEQQNSNQAPRNPEIGRCLWLEPKLTKTQYFRSVKAIARQLLGSEARLCFDHAIYKPPHSNCPTRWHQDGAYDPPVGGPNLRASFWLPLQNASVESGCLQFIPGSHKGDLLPHRHLAPGVHGLTTDCVDVSQAVPCPLPAGGLSIHHGRTLHCAGPNVTDQCRLAWILTFAVGGNSSHAKLMRLAAPFGRTFLGWPGRPSPDVDLL